MSEEFTPVAVVPIPVCLVFAEKMCFGDFRGQRGPAVPASDLVWRSPKSLSHSRASEADN